MKKALSTLCLITMVSFALVSCQQDANEVGPFNGSQKGQANAKKGTKVRVTLCHTDVDGTSYTLELTENAAENHLAHGDTPGSCTPTGTPN